jgi:hypothetical protein
VGSVVVVSVGEGIDQRLELVEAMRQLIAGVELVSPSTVAAFDRAVELRPFGRQHVEGEIALQASGLELGQKLQAAIDPRLRGGRLWRPETGKGIWAMILSRKRAARWEVARLAVAATVHLAIGS